MKIRIDKLEGNSMGHISNKLIIGNVYDATKGFSNEIYYSVNDGVDGFNWWLHPDDITIIEE